MHRDDGKRYAYDRISCMFRRYAKKCGLKDFGLYDLKGKAATDMYRAGVPLEQIQHLLLRRSAAMLSPNRRLWHDQMRDWSFVR